MEQKHRIAARLLFLWLLLATPALWAAEAPRTVTITMGDYQFNPDTIRVQVGETVRLRFLDTDLITPHNFILRDKAAGLDVSLDVGAGETASTTITPLTPGRYTFYCDKQLLFFKSHRERGMEGTLIVVPK